MIQFTNFRRRYGLYIIALIAVLPAMLLRDFTPGNELRYVSIAGEALENGTFFAFTNHGIPYADKPPLFLWICMLGHALFGINSLWFVSLFSIIPAFVITEVMARWAAPAIDRRWQLPAKLMLLTSVMFLGTALTMRMDMLMAMFIILALRVFYRRMNGDESPRLKYLFPIYVFLALFTKGPYGILIPLLSTIIFLAFTKRISLIGRFWGWRSWGIIISLCIIWFGAVFAEGGISYLDNLVVKQTVGRAVKSFAHDAPFWFYGISIWYSLAPWSLAIIGAIIATPVRNRFRREIPQIIRFFLTVALVTFVMLSIVSAKLAVYLLPAFPFFIYAGTFYLQRLENNLWCRIALAIPAAALAILPAFLHIAARKMPGIDSPLFYIATGLLSAAAIIGIILIFRHSSMQKGIISIAAGIGIFLFAGGLGLDTINPSIGYRDLADKTLSAMKNTGKNRVYTYRVSRAENLDVFFGQEVTMLEDGGAGPIIPRGASGLLIMRAKDNNADLKIIDSSSKYIITTLPEQQ